MKVLRVAAWFWVVKILTTAFGEATSDFFIHRIGLANTTALAGRGGDHGARAGGGARRSGQ